MALTEADVPNPPPGTSRIPDESLSMSVQLKTPKLDQKTAAALLEWRRAANYIAAGMHLSQSSSVPLCDAGLSRLTCILAMIFLADNCLVERDLTFDDIKPRLLGHWGTCPGLTLVYAHLNLAVRKHDLDMIYCVGPGHGAPAILAGLWLEGSMERFYPQYARNKQGLHNLISGFSTPNGLPRYVSLRFRV